MKSGHKALGILLVLCSLLLNPILLAKLFSNDGNITSISVLIGVIALEALILLIGFGVYLIRNSVLSKFGLALLSVIFSTAIMVGFDRFYGAFLMPETASLLFPPFSRATHNTAEFSLDVKINNLGFRGPNTTIKKEKKRVVVIGDSFTFGWGVELEETWLHLLSQAYPNIEILNLGQGGNHPGDYTRVAKRAISLLNPDLVVVCVLQGNDIHQLMRVIEYEQNTEKPTLEQAGVESKAERYQRYVRIVFPNLSKRYRLSVSIKKRWQADAQMLLSELSNEQRHKYDTDIDSNIRNWFEDGLLNPSLIYESLHHPNMLTESSDTINPLYKMGVIRLHDHLSEIAGVCETNGANLLVVEMPNRPYGFSETLKPLQELGYDLIDSDSVDATLAVKEAYKGLGLSLIQPTVIQQNKPIFYKYDGHWNAEGNRIFAKELSKHLEQNSEWKNFLTSSSF